MAFYVVLHSKPHTVRPQNTLRSSGILPIHSRKLTQMTKIGNGLYVLVLLNENAHGCHTWLQHRTNHRNTIRL